MNEFIQFTKHLWKAIWFLRGVLVSLIVILFICTLLMAWAEDDLTFWDSAYLIMITALTVGYGDITPTTPLGKVMSVIAGFHGILITGIAVAIATRALQHAYSDKVRAYQLLHPPEESHDPDDIH